MCYWLSQPVESDETLRLGLVNRVFSDDVLEDETMALARRLASGPRLAIRYMKRNLNAADSGTLDQVLDLEALHHARAGQTEDHAEAVRAFVEKREPVFRGCWPLMTRSVVPASSPSSICTAFCRAKTGEGQSRCAPRSKRQGSGATLPARVHSASSRFRILPDAVSGNPPSTR